MNRIVIAVAALLVAVAVVGSSAFFIVQQGQQALVLQFGDPRRVIKEPGLQFKLPLIQNVLYYDRRLLEVDPKPQQVILADQKRIEVDAFARYRITDPLTFYQTVNNEQGARSRIESILNSSMRRVLGGTSMASVLSSERDKIMNDIRTEVQDDVKRFGVQVLDVRLRRADLPETTSQAIYNRMRSEREREAREFRAQGQEHAQQIRSRADREKVVLVAEAQREAQILRGEGDAVAIKTYAEAFDADPEFFSFYRSLQSYREALGTAETTLVLSPNSEFFRYFNKLPPAPAKR